MAITPSNNFEAAEKQLNQALGNSLGRLKGIWAKQGYLQSDSPNHETNFFNSKLLPVINTLLKVIAKEEMDLELLKAETQDNYARVGQLCTILQRPIDEYCPYYDLGNEYTFEINNHLIKSIEILEYEIKTRKEKIHEAVRQCELVGSELFLETKKFSLEEVDDDLSSSIYGPILHEEHKLISIKANRTSLFNTAVSWLYHKWTILSLVPEEKDEIDLALEKLFSSGLPDIIKMTPLYFWVPRYQADTDIFDWYSRITSGDKLSLSLDLIKELFDKTICNDENIENEVVIKKQMYERLKKLYKIAELNIDEQESVLDNKGNLFLNKLEYEHSRMLSYIDNKKEALYRNHMTKLQKIWNTCSVSKREMESNKKRIDGMNITLETLELMIDDYDNQRFQFDNAPDVYSKIKQRKIIIDKLRDFEAKLNAKGHSRFKGNSLHLLEEEKFRKYEYPMLGKLENSLIEPIKQYEKEHNKYFLFEGGRFLAILQGAIERRAGNVEIIGLNDAASLESFNKPKIPRAQPIHERTTKSSSQRTSGRETAKSSKTIVGVKSSPSTKPTKLSPPGKPQSSSRLSNSSALSVTKKSPVKSNFDSPKNSRKSSINTVSSTMLPSLTEKSTSSETVKLKSFTSLHKSSSESLSTESLSSPSESGFSPLQCLLDRIEVAKLNDIKPLQTKQKSSTKMVIKEAITKKSGQAAPKSTSVPSVKQVQKIPINAPSKIISTKRPATAIPSQASTNKIITKPLPAKSNTKATSAKNTAIASPKTMVSKPTSNGYISKSTYPNSSKAIPPRSATVTSTRTIPTKLVSRSSTPKVSNTISKTTISNAASKSTLKIKSPAQTLPRAKSSIGNKTSTSTSTIPPTKSIGSPLVKGSDRKYSTFGPSSLSKLAKSDIKV